MRMKRMLYLLFILCLACSVSAQTQLTVAKDFSVKDLEGTTHHLFDYLDSNNYVLIDFFTTSCGSCQIYASEVNAVYNDFGCNAGNVVVLGINWGSNNANVQAFDSAYGAFYPAVSGTQGGGNRVVDTFQVLSYPTVILIAPDRQILEQYIWPPSQQMLDSIILAHGGLLQPCTVNTDEIVIPVSELPLSVWPNPSSGIVNIGVNAGPGIEVTIVTIQGRIIQNYPWENSSENRLFQVKRIFGLSPGMFIVLLKKDGIIIGTQKLVIKQ
jgi:thiol-disulfide isomerase/thioredoxin